MIHSMTGYGHGRAARDATSVAVELSAVNHKQRDFRFSIPPELAFLEAPLKSMLSDAVLRGSITLALTCDLSPEYRASQVEIDKELAGHIIREFKALGEQYGLSGELRPGDLVVIPGILRERNDVLPRELLTELAKQALSQALEAFDAARRKEGEAIWADLDERAKTLGDLVKTIEAGRDETLETYRDQLRKRIEELGVPLAPDDDRLAREVAFVAQKADITEELVRLRSHIEQFRGFLENDDPGAGRQLQFQAQEMLREINTLGSKTRQTAVSRDAIAFKAELDRIREQVCNVE